VKPDGKEVLEKAASLILVDPRDSNFDKGKTTERWRRKVTGLTGASPRTAGPPKFSPNDCLGPGNIIKWSGTRA
jgi:hypothetical protein